MAGRAKSFIQIGEPVDIRAFHGGVYTERYLVVSADSGITSGEPPNSVTGVNFKGKFCPRMMRGMLMKLSVYCKRTGSGTLKLAYSPNPGLGEIGTVTITPGSDWSWVDGNVNKMWNYDSLFIWVKDCSADVSYAYDEKGGSYGYSSADSGATWTIENRRHYFRAVFYGKTEEDLPVSGTVNVVELPNTAGALEALTFRNAGPASGSIAFFDGPGVLTGFQVVFKQTSGTVTSNNMQIIIYIDDYVQEDTVAGLLEAVASTEKTNSPLSFGKIDDTNHIYMFAYNFKLPFKRKLRVELFNISPWATPTPRCDITMFWAIEKLK
jgi:hypothetical protein